MASRFIVHYSLYQRDGLMDEFRIVYEKTEQHIVAETLNEAKNEFMRKNPESTYSRFDILDVEQDYKPLSYDEEKEYYNKKRSEEDNRIRLQIEQNNRDYERALADLYETKLKFNVAQTSADFASLNRQFDKIAGVFRSLPQSFSFRVQTQIEECKNYCKQCENYYEKCKAKEKVEQEKEKVKQKNKEEKRKNMARVGLILQIGMMLAFFYVLWGTNVIHKIKSIIVAIVTSGIISLMFGIISQLFRKEADDVNLEFLLELKQESFADGYSIWGWWLPGFWFLILMLVLSSITASVWAGGVYRGYIINTILLLPPLVAILLAIIEGKLGGIGIFIIIVFFLIGISHYMYSFPIFLMLAIPAIPGILLMAKAEKTY